MDPVESDLIDVLVASLSDGVKLSNMARKRPIKLCKNEHRRRSYSRPGEKRAQPVGPPMPQLQAAGTSLNVVIIKPWCWIQALDVNRSASEESGKTRSVLPSKFVFTSCIGFWSFHHFSPSPIICMTWPINALFPASGVKLRVVQLAVAAAFIFNTPDLSYLIGHLLTRVFTCKTAPDGVLIIPFTHRWWR